MKRVQYEIGVYNNMMQAVTAALYIFANDNRKTRIIIYSASMCMLIMINMAATTNK